MCAILFSMRAPILCLLATGLLLGQDPSQTIDKLFERFGLDSPGCAIGIAQNGKALFAKGYGLADLEHNAPLSPSSPFYMASVSKQFTAMSILLLAEDGKLALTDPVRKYIPELPEYASGITIYHLLTHTSGVRDYLALGFLAGLPAEFVFTDGGMLHMLARQAALNFEPGTDYLYSNSGYVLLSLIVKKVAQKSLNEFAQERIFGPLGMKATRFQHDHSMLIPGKALGYQRREGVWHTANSMLDVVGDGGLYSTVDDMVRWAENFDKPKVGAVALTAMQTQAKLSSGKEIEYGMGLAPSAYRGLRIVEHGGALVGYRTEFLRFPGQGFSVVCLCNNGSANPGQLARQVAELYLNSELKPPETTKGNSPQAPNERSVGAPVPLSENDLKSYTGEFESRELNAIYRIAAESDVLSIEPGDRPAVRLRGSGPDRMRAAGTGMEFEFVRDSAGRVTGFYLTAGRVRKIRFERSQGIKKP
jgi:CubicO group peptidase (beta-lactamase class C family)